MVWHGNLISIHISASNFKAHGSSEVAAAWPYDLLLMHNECRLHPGRGGAVVRCILRPLLVH